MNEFDQLQALISSIPHTDAQARARALERQAQLTKPRGALGRLEGISVWLAGVYGTERPRITGKAVIVCAGDHGVTREGVSAYPSEVTPAMVLNFLAGGAAVNAISRVVNANVIVLDVGVNADLPAHPHLIASKIRRGTGNIAIEPAMTKLEAAQAILAGARAADQAIANGANLLAVGEMGIGNTTVASAITALVVGSEVPAITGLGTGVDQPTLERKQAVIARIVERVCTNANVDDPLELLAQAGGLEIAAMVGVMLAGACARVPVTVDGFIAGAAALIATQFNPDVLGYLTASHVSQEPGHAVQLEYLRNRNVLTEDQFKPLFDLEMRLGEGTGALLAMPVLEAAARTLADMATFGEAQVPDQSR